MGWTYEYAPGSRLKQFIAERAKGWDYTDPETGERRVTECLAHKYSMHNPGSGSLWKVMKTSRYTVAGELKIQELWIAMDMIRWGGGKELGWGYKDVESTMGLYDLSCPLKYLEMVPEQPQCLKAACEKSPYGEGGCKCGGCHGCSSCYERRWRTQVRAKADAAARTRAFIKGLRPGDRVVLKAGWRPAAIVIGAVYSRGITSDFGAKIPLRAIDVDASRAAVHSGV